MKAPIKREHEGLGLPHQALQAILAQIPTRTKHALLRCSRTVRQEVVLCAPVLRFTPQKTRKSLASSNRNEELRHELQRRTDPLRLVLEVANQGPAGEDMAVWLAEVAATSRPARGAQGTPMCCVEELVVEMCVDV